MSENYPDDLNSMLDECLEEVEAQEARHKEEEERRAQELLVTSNDNASDDPNIRNLQGVFLTLASALQNPQDLESPEAIAKLQATLTSTIQSLEADPNATAEEKAELDRCAAMVRNLGNVPATDDQEVPLASAEDTAKLADMLQELMRTVAPEGAEQQHCENHPLGGSHDPATMECHPETTDKDISALLGLLSDPDKLLEPFLRMSEKYPRFLQDNKATLDPAEYLRYERQLGVMQQITSLFKDGKIYSDEDDTVTRDERLKSFTDAVQRLQELGLPPPQLVAHSE